MGNPYGFSTAYVTYHIDVTFPAGALHKSGTYLWLNVYLRSGPALMIGQEDSSGLNKRVVIGISKHKLAQYKCILMKCTAATTDVV